MKVRAFRLCVAVIVGASLAGPARSSSQSDGGGTLAITGATLIDGTGRPPIEDAVVVLSGGRIQEAGSSSRVRVPDNAQRLDARGKWLMPGLIDGHVHFQGTGGLYSQADRIGLAGVPAVPEEERARAQLPVTLKRYLCGGVTAVAEWGGPPWAIEARHASLQAEAAPRVILSARVSPRDPEIAAFDGSDAPTVRRRSREQVRRAVASKPDLIKISRGNRYNDTVEQLAPVYEGATAEAHAHGLAVGVHVIELDLAKAALRAGADFLVHDVMDLSVDDEFVALMRERRVLYISTFTPPLHIFELFFGDGVQFTDIERACGDRDAIESLGLLRTIPRERLPPGQISDERRQVLYRNLRTGMRNLKRLHDAGVAIGAGTDASVLGVPHGASLHRQMEVMVEAGLTPMDVIVAATANNAQVFGRHPEIGTVAPGKLADLLILDADPTKDIRNVRRISKVIRGGRVFEYSALRTNH